MATKGNDPCLDKAEPQEELFTLLARDVLAPGIVREWANRAEQYGTQPAAWIEEARACADKMDAWREEHRPEKTVPPGCE